MSILIRGEEMPKNCVVCKNYYYCELWSKLTVNKRCKERHPDCPIVEVKEPHGRLCDLDKLMTEFMDSDLDHLQRDDWKEVIQIIADAPTITSEPHWILCSEGLPKEEGFYLVTIGYKRGAETNIRYFKIENGKRYWSLWGNENITAWMPKPEPFKGVTE